MRGENPTMPSPARIMSAQRSGNRVELQVQTDNLGQKNQGGVRISDKAGHTVDVPLTWKRKSGRDDLFEGVAVVDAALDPEQLSARGFVDVPKRSGAIERLWGDVDVPVAESPEAALAKRLVE